MSLCNRQARQNLHNAENPRRNQEFVKVEIQKDATLAQRCFPLPSLLSILNNVEIAQDLAFQTQ